MVKKEKRSGTHINRRTFLKGMAATGAMASITATNPASAAQSASENKTATKSWRDKPDPIDESLISDGGTYDVVVVDGGNAGLACARAASMNGASVAVIENQAENNYVRGVGSQPGTVNSHVMACPPKPTVLLEVSGWKFFYGAATFSGNRGASAKTAGGMPGGAGGAVII